MVLQNFKMRLTPLTLYVVLAMTMLFVMEVTGATYKKPPFNGSIFGKRSNGITEYENTGRTLSTLCEIASEACSAWFPQVDVKKK